VDLHVGAKLVTLEFSWVVIVDLVSV